MTAPHRYEPDDWKPDGPKITDVAQMEKMRLELDRRGPILLKHWHYRGARSPTYIAFDDYDSLVEYLEKYARPGDAFDAWTLADLCDGLGTLAAGKYPDVDGCVPTHGAY